MEMIRQWIIGITCAAMLIAVADSLTPNGTVKKIGRLVGGLVMLLSVVQPITTLDYSVLAMSAVPYQAASKQIAADLNESNNELMKTIIGEKTGAYILDKAKEFGIPCQSVVVTCRMGENEIPYPSDVTVVGPMTDIQRAKLSRSIEADLAIPAQRQIFECGE